MPKTADPAAARRAMAMARDCPSRRHRPLVRLAAVVSGLCEAVGAGAPARRLRRYVADRLFARAVEHQEVAELVAGADAEQRVLLLHLLRCRRCRRRQRRWLSLQLDRQMRAIGHEEREAEEGRPGTDDQAAPPAVRPRLPPAWPPAAPLAAGPGPDAAPRAGQVGDAAALVAAAASQVADPAAGEQLAARALAALSCEWGLWGAPALAVRLGALALLLRYRHRQGRLAEAEAVYEEALAPLSTEPALSRPRASLLAALAQLRWSQARRDEAAALFAAAAWTFVRVDEIQADAACRVQAGLVLLEDGNHQRAQPLLELGWGALDAERAPALAARAAYALAYCRAAQQPRARVAGILRGAAAAGLGVGEETSRAWWLGQIATCKRRHRQAAALLDAARRRLLTRGSLGEAARSSLDLLLARVWSGQRDGLAGLGADLAAAFGGHPDAARCGEDLEAAANLAAKGSPLLESNLWMRHRLYAQLRPNELRPDLIASAQSLADPLLVEPETRLGELAAGRLAAWQR
jgi:hypothetical protein